jgi:hypothetical protein
MNRPKRLDPIMVLTMNAEKMMPRKGPTSCPPAWPRTRRQGKWVRESQAEAKDRDSWSIDHDGIPLRRPM